MLLVTVLMAEAIMSLQPLPEVQQPQHYFQVQTSWYDLDGQTMANGQKFDQKNPKLAAHKKLPLGTKIELKNPQNNRSLIIEISDRGPFIRDRDLDVSKAAADFLGFTEKGVTTLCAKVIVKPKKRS